MNPASQPCRTCKYFTAPERKDVCVYPGKCLKLDTEVEASNRIMQSSFPMDTMPWWTGCILWKERGR